MATQVQVFFAVAIASTLFTVTIAWSMCYQCDHVTHPGDCDKFVICSEHQSCFTQKLRDFSNDVYFKLGCENDNVCQRLPVSLVGKRDDEPRDISTTSDEPARDETTSTERDRDEKRSMMSRQAAPTSLCLQCCNGNGCNNGSDCGERTGMLVPTKPPAHTTSRPTTAHTTSRPTTDCFYESTRYQGNHRTTVTGAACVAWTGVQHDNFASGPGFPDRSFADAGNKCRDPTGRGHPWCYTTPTLDWEYCDVSYCAECYFKSASRNYNGHVSKDVNNNTCDQWTSYKGTLPFNAAMFPGHSIANSSNYCRDIFGIGPMCVSNGQLQSCGVPECTEPCHDDPSTSCDLIKDFVCPKEYSRKTLCAKTCGDCGFGLLPPRIISPPRICADVTGANCHLIKDFICQNVTAAKILCPLTCNVGCGTCADIPGANCHLIKDFICINVTAARKLCPQMCNVGCSISGAAVTSLTSSTTAATTAATTTSTTAATTTTTSTTTATTTTTAATTTTPRTTPTTTTATTTTSPTTHAHAHIPTTASTKQSGRLCYTCQNMAHPRDCRKITQCAIGQECFVESVVTNAGQLRYTSGCDFAHHCTLGSTKRRAVDRRSASFVNRVDLDLDQDSSMAQYRGPMPIGQNDDLLNLVLCFMCCDGSDYCNSNLCDTSKPSSSYANRTSCLTCSNVTSPDKCDVTSLCDVNEVCFTEEVIIQGEVRYRMGCVRPESCSANQNAVATNLVGKKRFLFDWFGVLRCAQCCHDTIGNCNRDLCRAGAHPRKGTWTGHLLPSSTTTAASTTASSAQCHDDTVSGLCTDSDVRYLVCQDPTLAVSRCPKSCGYCDCKDVLNCSSQGARDHFCSDKTLSAQFCKKTCNKCVEPNIKVTLNSCQDPVEEGMCPILNEELCVCHDPDIRQLCKHYCNGECATRPRSCTIPDDTHNRRSEVFRRVVQQFNSRR